MQNQQQPNPVDLTMQVANGFVASSCISAITRVKIADHLASGPKSVKDLAKTSETNEDILYRVLRALSSIGLFRESSPRVFENTPSSEFLRADHPQSMRPMVIWMTNAFHFDTHRDMLPTLRDGKPIIEHIYHKPAFALLDELPDVAREFNDAMTNFSAAVIPAVLEAYDFTGIGALADIAGGHGFVLTAIVQKYPQMKGIIFDLDSVVPGAKDRVAKLGLSNRVQVLSGDFFQSVPAADAYIMKSIIHDWDDEPAIRILKNCGKNLSKGGRVILVEAVMIETGEPHFSKWMDIEMFMMPGGRERTATQFKQLFQAAGFELTKVVQTKSPMCVIEAKKL